jgi:hypothetical protein
MEDDDPPIKSHPASKEYLANWEATFGESEEPEKKPEPIESEEDRRHMPDCEKLCTDGAACNCGTEYPVPTL